MVIKITPPEITEEKAHWASLLLIFSILFFLFSIFGYFFILYSLKSTQENIQNLQGTLQAGKTGEQRTLEEKVLAYQQKIQDISLLLRDHKKTTNVFEAIEKFSHPQVYLTRFKLDSEKAVLELEGITESFQNLAQQKVLWQGSPFFKEVDIARVSLVENGKIEFMLSIFLSPELLTQ